MADKVLAIIRETMLHENSVEGISFRPANGEILLSLLHPDDRWQYPEHELQLTFSGVRSFAIDDARGDRCHGETLLGFQCEAKEGIYAAEISIGDPGTPRWVMSVVFAGLRYQRSPKDT